MILTASLCLPLSPFSLSQISLVLIFCEYLRSVMMMDMIMALSFTIKSYYLDSPLLDELLKLLLMVTDRWSRGIPVSLWV